MISRRLCYLALLAMGGCLTMLYNYQGLRFLLGCLVTVPLGALLLALPGKFLCRVSLEAAQTEVMRGETAEFAVKVENRSLFPVARLRMELYWEATGDKAVRERMWLCGLAVKQGERFSLELFATHCGMAALTIRKASVCDFLGLFSLTVARRERAQVCVLPVIEPVSAQVLELCSLNCANPGAEREGDLLLRDFRPGDSLHRIYWKLAAKEGELQVRDFERSGRVTLFLDFSDGFARQADNWDQYLDRACSMLYFFAQEGRQALQMSLEVVWRKGELYLKTDIPDGAAALAWTAALLEGRAAGAFLTEEEVLSLGNGWRLEEDGGLYYGNAPVMETPSEA
nr:DUF58 domain-containing protein [uncultured Acetatifactor sp.]